MKYSSYPFWITSSLAGLLLVVNTVAFTKAGNGCQSTDLGTGLGIGASFNWIIGCSYLVMPFTGWTWVIGAWWRLVFFVLVILAILGIGPVIYRKQRR